MATTTLTNVFRRDAFVSVFDFANDAFNMALYNASGHDANTTAYTVTNECPSTGNYTAGGNVLSGIAASLDTTNNVAYYDWADTSWASSTITATDCLLYDDTVTTPTANMSIYVGDFGGERSTSNGTFQITMPSATFSTALVRLA